ncbi:MAG: HIT family protein [Betaproteobacteria bacterium]|nr:HIT family protein [Betaproteobacteria bacterium]
MACELCETDGGELIWRDAQCRVVRVAEPGYPGFCRAIWNAHIKEMTDLTAAERARLLQVVFALESALRKLLRPDKINLASLGNVTPHLHWHVIPRFRDDPHFPNPVWGSLIRQPDARAHASIDIAAALARELSRLGVCRT